MPLLLGGKVPETPIIQHQHVHFGELVQELLIASIGVSDLQILHESGQSVILCPKVLQARLVCKRAGQVAFSDSGCAGDDDVLVTSYPLTTGQMQHEMLIESAALPVVDIRHRGLTLLRHFMTQTV